MKNAPCFIVLLSMFFLTSCSFLKNTKEYKKDSMTLIQEIMEEDYENAHSHFNYDTITQPFSPEFETEMRAFRQLIVDKFGDDIEISNFTANKTYFDTKKSGPYPTILDIQIENKTHFGYLKAYYNDSTGKVDNLTLTKYIGEIPSPFLFILFALFPLFVLSFNIYTIRKVRRSSVKRKGLKIFGIVVLNIPAITYFLMGRLSINFLELQILLGISIGFAGYAGSYFTFGIPVGSLLAHMRLVQHKKKEMAAKEEVIENNENIDLHED